MENKIEHIIVSSESFSPRVLFCNLTEKENMLTKGRRYPERYANDYELEYITQSDGAMYIDDKLYHINKGDIVFRRPGQFTQGIAPYMGYLVCFDLLNSTGKKPETYNFCARSKYENEFQDYYIEPALEVIPCIFHPVNTEKYAGLFELIYGEYINQRQTSQMLIKSYILQILSHLSNDVYDMKYSAVKPSAYSKTVKKVLDFISENYKSKIRLDTMAAFADLSPAYLHKIFKDTVGITPNEYITKLRMEHAKELLLNTQLQVYKVGMECGIDNVPYFSYLFKKYYGSSPLEFKRKYGRGE